jgi:pimeloyl-ACP methyl ester carboxylesterase
MSVESLWVQAAGGQLHWHAPRTVYTERLSEVRAATLIIHGERDRLVPLAAAREAQRRIRGARLHIMQNCGHWPQRERPAEFNRVLCQFLFE